MSFFARRALPFHFLLDRSTRLIRYSHPLRKSYSTDNSNGLSSVVPGFQPTIPNVQTVLRDYQEECIQSVLDHYNQGHTRLGVSLATGSGKTVIFTQLVDRIPSRGDASRTLILAHRRELVEQAARHCQTQYPDKTIEVEMAASHASGNADITIASVPSITATNRLDKFDRSKFKLIIVDEAHHITASRYVKVLDHFQTGNDEIIEKPLLVGVSATFARHDGIKLGSCIDYIVYHKDFVDMIQSKWLCMVRFTSVDFRVDLSKLRTGSNGDFNAAALSKLVNTPQANEVTVRAWLARAHETEKPRKSTIVFCADISHVVALTDLFRKCGVDAQYVTGETPVRVRADRVDAFRRGEFPVMINCGVFSEGTDISNIDCVILARPTRSRTLLIQMIGRGMRLHPGKEDCLILDMVSSFKTGLATTPTLFGLDPDTIVENASAKDLANAKKEVGGEKNKKGNSSDVLDANAEVTDVKFSDYDSVTDLLEDVSGNQIIWALSSNAWVQVGYDRYVLSSYPEGYLTIQRPDPEEEQKAKEAKEAKDATAKAKLKAQKLNQRSKSKAVSVPEAEGEEETEEAEEGPPPTLDTPDDTPPPAFIVKYTPRLSAAAIYLMRRSGRGGGGQYGRTTQIAEGPTFETVVHAADTFANGNFPRVSIFRFEQWRQRPASKAQKDFLSGFYKENEPSILSIEEEQEKLGKESKTVKMVKTVKKKKIPDHLTKGMAADFITKIKFGVRTRFTDIESDKRRVMKAQAKRESDSWMRDGQSKVKVGAL